MRTSALDQSNTKYQNPFSVFLALICIPPGRYSCKQFSYSPNQWFQLQILRRVVRLVMPDERSFMTSPFPCWRHPCLVLPSCEMYLQEPLTIVNVFILLVIPDCNSSILLELNFIWTILRART